ncbi:conserved hypothetical protein, secreted [Candidatus Desulfofervidus auxilii]|uniref:DUF4139 domain-containing protein n=1 Tax=Desulfofervidus auxilii TaxID=1621989 RepID=A0A7U4QKV5_DESA2|nr:DUF4139 domain-containing protein [Candidatus Desulfofervidus auxilii]AMM41225.1 conserved hypothetical protein, secreted [Candidatus Desulfofervidus auxilii]
MGIKTYISLVVSLVVFFSPVYLKALQFFKITAQHRESIQLVIYNQNFALVREIRRINLPFGEYYLQVENIPEKIEPESVVLYTPENFKLLSQDYRYDLITSKTLLDKYVGKDVKVYFENPYTGKKELTDGILLSNQDKPICSIKGEVFIPCPGKIILPQLPSGLFSLPTLVWHVENSSGGEQLIQFSYLTQDINWQADYVLVLTEEKKADLTGWATIMNQSGASYPAAQVALVAGQVHKTKSPPVILYQAKAQREDISHQPQEQAFFEYRLYTLSQTLNLENNQKKQVRFLKKTDVSINEQFIYRGQNYYYRTYYDTPISKDKIWVYLETVNDAKNNLAIPLPPGKVRVYQKDSLGNMVFIGEDKIPPTPINKKIKLNIGMAFDIEVSRHQTVYRRLSGSLYEIGWEISFKNNKERFVKINVFEDVPGDWEVVNASAPYQKTSAHELKFIILVPAQGETKLHYLVRVKD